MISFILFESFLGGNCTAAQYQCNNGFCIDQDFVCDEHFDCADGDDELNCTVCPMDYVHCDSHVCVPKNTVCDGHDDCGDGSDEARCCKSF